MADNLLNTIEGLTAATGNGVLTWRNISGTKCLTTSYGNDKILICKYIFSENGKVVVSFNFLDEDNRIKGGEVDKWEIGKEPFEKLDALYELASKHILQTA